MISERSDEKPMKTTLPERGRTTRPTLADVARVAGLARTTVSDILNRGESSRYADETRQRVQKAVKQLGYSPSRAAQIMASGRSGLIGLLLTRDFSNPYWARLVHWVERELASRSFRLEMAVAGADDADTPAITQQLVGTQIEGLIVAPVYNAEDTRRCSAALRLPMPVAVFGTPMDPADSVGIDEYASGRLMIEHLLARGHRRIACLGVPDAQPELSRITVYAAIRDLLRQQGCFRPDWIIAHADTGDLNLRFAQCRDFAQRWSAAAPAARPTAVICHNDQLAMTALAAFHQAGIRVPQDLSVVGHDNLPESAYLTPALTTIDAHPAHQVAMLVDLVLSRRQHPGRPFEQRSIRPTLVERQSVADLT